MDSIFELLRQSRKASQFANDLEGRSPFSTFGIVTNNQDPLDKRRVKVTLQSKGGQCETDWLWRILPSPNDDPPVPKVGQTVEVSFTDGDPHQGCYKGVLTNQPNPEQATANPLLDDARVVEGDRSETVQGKADLRTDANHTLSVGQKLRLQNDAGAYLELAEDGRVILGDAFGHTLTLGAGSGNDTMAWDFNGHQLNAVNVGGFSLNGHQAIVLGSVDTRGDANNDRGY